MLASLRFTWDNIPVSYKPLPKHPTQIERPKGHGRGRALRSSSAAIVPPAPDDPARGGAYPGRGDGRLGVGGSLWGAIVPLGVRRR